MLGFCACPMTITMTPHRLMTGWTGGRIDRWMDYGFELPGATLCFCKVRGSEMANAVLASPSSGCWSMLGMPGIGWTLSLTSGTALAAGSSPPPPSVYWYCNCCCNPDLDWFLLLLTNPSYLAWVDSSSSSSCTLLRHVSVPALKPTALASDRDQQGCIWGLWAMW